MKPWTRKQTLLAGLALILASNAVVLAGVAYNRAPEPDAALALTQRELAMTRDPEAERENSGVTLKLQWRVLRSAASLDYYDYNYPYAADAGWLDRTKLEQLGFDLSQPAPDPLLVEDRYEKQLPRSVLLVLELDGAAYASALKRAETKATDAQRELAGNPASTQLKSSAKTAEEILARERTANSRLFVVDADLDAAVLRAKYPDRKRYAIVPGKVGLESYAGQRRAGYLHGPSIAEINVPLQFHDAARAPAFEASVVFGRRLEPWLAAAAATSRRAGK
jgi:hypothetical protein